MRMLLITGGIALGLAGCASNKPEVTVAYVSPAAYNSLLASLAREQTYGFWSAEQALSNLDVGHYQTYSATVDTAVEDIAVRLMTAYRTFDNTGHQPRPGGGDEHLQVQHPRL